MIKMISYSVAIRTIGTAGDKYYKLLQAIQRLTIKPEKIIVVLPEGGGTPPKSQFGSEEFVYSRKGMVYQRIAALDYITSDYILLCDDDVEPEPQFIEKLMDSVQTGGYSCASGPLLEFFPSGSKAFLTLVAGRQCVMLHGRKNHYVRILGTGGWSYNRSIDMKSHKVYDTQSLAGTCSFINTKALRDIHFEDELWLERNGYAAFDDQVMFYKMILNGYKICVVSDARYIHNDAKTATKGLKTEPDYAYEFARYVFWHRFLYSQTNGIKKLWIRICNHYFLSMDILSQFFMLRCGMKTKEEIDAAKRGLFDAKEFVKSEQYANLPNARLSLNQ